MLTVVFELFPMLIPLFFIYFLDFQWKTLIFPQNSIRLLGLRNSVVEMCIKSFKYFVEFIFNKNSLTDYIGKMSHESSTGHILWMYSTQSNQSVRNKITHVEILVELSQVFSTTSILIFSVILIAVLLYYYYFKMQ